MNQMSATILTRPPTSATATSQALDNDKRQLFRTRSNNTNSFRQYMNKPNKVAHMSSRRSSSSANSKSSSSSGGGVGPGGGMDPHLLRGGSLSGVSTSSSRRVQRAKSTTALRRVSRSDHHTRSGAASGVELATAATTAATPGSSGITPGEVSASVTTSGGASVGRHRCIKSLASTTALTPATAASSASTVSTTVTQGDNDFIVVDTQIASPTTDEQQTGHIHHRPASPFPGCNIPLHIHSLNAIP